MLMIPVDHSRTVPTVRACERRREKCIRITDHDSAQSIRQTDLVAQRRGGRDYPPDAAGSGAAAAATVVRRGEMRAGGERGEMRQRRGRRQNGGEGVQLFPGGANGVGRIGRRRGGLAVDGVVEVDGVQRLVNEPFVDGHADLRGKPPSGTRKLLFKRLNIAF